MRASPGTTFAVEAEEPLASDLAGFAEELGGRAIRRRAEDKVLYHAAAAIASNYLVVLASLSADLWAGLGAERSEAIGALMPLLKGTLGNLERVGLPVRRPPARSRGATSGPSWSAPRSARRARAGDLPGAEILLGREAIRIALEKGTLGEERAAKLEALLADAASRSTEGGEPCA